jgi:hypothetical protein
VALVALALFALSSGIPYPLLSQYSYSHFRSSQSIWDAYPAVGDTLNNIFIAALFFVLTASFAAFIPGAPFHSPLSGVSSGSSSKSSPTGPSADLSAYALSVLSSCPYQSRWSRGSLVQGGRLVPSILHQHSTSISGPCVPPLFVSRDSSRGGRAGAAKTTPIYSSYWLYSHSIVIIILSSPSHTCDLSPCVSSFSLSDVLPYHHDRGRHEDVAVDARRGKAKAEAVAWMIKTQPSRNLLMFQNAVEIARNSSPSSIYAPQGNSSCSGYRHQIYSRRQRARPQR